MANGISKNPLLDINKVYLTQIAEGSLKSLEKASVLAMSDKPEDQDKAREIKTRFDYQSLMKQKKAKKGKVMEARSNWRHDLREIITTEKDSEEPQIKEKKIKNKVPSIAVIGTGIDSGKTTVTSFIIKTLSNYYKRINACKLAGTASQKDLYSYEDNGAYKTSDFVDYGLPSTCMNDKETIQNCSASIISDMSKDAEIILMELAIKISILLIARILCSNF